MDTASKNQVGQGRDAAGPEQLRALIGDSRVRAVFQPIVDLSRGTVIAYEALSRPEERSGYAGPLELFEAAVRHGMLWELETVTRRVSLEAAANWPDDVKLFLNNTPEVFGDSRFVDAITAELRAWADADGRVLRPDRIVLEITEQSEEQHVRGLREQLSRLKTTGVEIAIDDVGAGTSGMSRIMALRPQWLKLDREFVEGIHNDKMKQNLVRFFVHFAGLSGVNVIAEGIEDREELTELIGIGVRYGQGYYLGKPAPLAECLDSHIGAWVRRQWAAAASGAVESIQTTPVARLCKPAMLVQSSVSAGEVMTLLGLEPEFEGVVVFDGRRCVGSCCRSALSAAIRWRGHDVAVGSIAMESPAISPEATLAEALQVVVSRRDEELSTPLVVADGAEVIGVLTVRELLRAAAAVKGVDRDDLSMAGLPGREEADRHIAGLVAAARNRPTAAPWDAAFVDVRKFAHVTGMFGGEVGGRLVESVGVLLKDVVVQGSDMIRAWHLGDDRFMVVGPTGQLEQRLRKLMETFDHSCTAFGCALPGASEPVPQPQTDESETGALPSVSIRVLLMPDAFSRIEGPSDLYRLEHELRQRARNQERTTPQGKSMLVTDVRGGRISSRLTA